MVPEPLGSLVDSSVVVFREVSEATARMGIKGYLRQAHAEMASVSSFVITHFSLQKARWKILFFRVKI